MVDCATGPPGDDTVMRNARTPSRPSRNVLGRSADDVAMFTCSTTWSFKVVARNTGPGIDVCDSGSNAPPAAIAATLSRDTRGALTSASALAVGSVSKRAMSGMFGVETVRITRSPTRVVKLPVTISSR